MKYEATNEGYKRYLGLWKREMPKWQAKGAYLEGLSAIPKTFSEYEYELLTAADKAMAKGEKFSNYTFENKVAHDMIYTNSHAMTAAQGRNLYKAQEKLNEILKNKKFDPVLKDALVGDHYDFTAEELSLEGFHKEGARGYNFFKDLDTLYHLKLEGNSIKSVNPDDDDTPLDSYGAKYWLAQYIFGSD